MSSIRCHYVPQFYLNYFLPPNSSLFWVYDKKINSSRPQNPLNTTVIGDYYLTSPDEKGNKNDFLESFFSKIEDKTKPALDDIIAQPQKWNINNISFLASFLAFLHCRVPRAINTVKEMLSARVDLVFEEMVKTSNDSDALQKDYDNFCRSNPDIASQITIDDFKSFLSDPRKFGTPSINDKYPIGLSVSVAEGVYPYLMKMNWRVLAIVNNSNHFFITSDAPHVVFVPSGDGKALFGSGFGLPNVQIAFPINPKLCLWLDNSSCTKNYEIIQNRQIEEINRRIIHISERFVISPYKSNRIGKMVYQTSSLYGKPKIDPEVAKEEYKKHFH